MSATSLNLVSAAWFFSRSETKLRPVGAGAERRGRADARALDGKGGGELGVGARLDPAPPAKISADDREHDHNRDDRPEDWPATFLDQSGGVGREMGEFVVLQMMTFCSLHIV